MRTITLIVVHCSANKAGSTIRMADIDRYHRSLGWKGCGYHYVILLTALLSVDVLRNKSGRIAKIITDILSGWRI